MINCFPDPVPPPNERSFILVERLRLIFYVQIGLSLIRILFGDSGNAIMDLFAAFVLWQGYTSLNFCSMVVYLFMIALDFIRMLTVLGTVIQNGSNLGFFALLIYFFSLIFYGVALYFAFQAYKEFKALAYGGESASLLGGTSLPMYSRSQQNAQSYNQGNQGISSNAGGSGGNGFQAFKGKGVSLG